jgi:hypothetical protein
MNYRDHDYHDHDGDDDCDDDCDDDAADDAGRGGRDSRHQQVGAHVHRCVPRRDGPAAATVRQHKRAQLPELAAPHRARLRPVLAGPLLQLLLPVQSRER